MAIKLFEHNRTAYEAAVAMLRDTGKAAIIHPTGTGKSFIGFKLCEDNPEKRFLWLSPSEYIFKTQIENLAKTGADVPANINFITYKKLTLLTDDELSDLHPDYLICDEYHRAGAETWNEAVLKLLAKYPNVPMLGLSATNIRYLDNQRDMAAELFDGNIASRMTLGEAIVRGILNPPKYIMSVYSYRDELEKYEQKIGRSHNKRLRDEAGEYLEKLRRALEKADGLDEVFRKHMTEKHGKFIVFCSNFEAMQECISHAKEWFSKVDTSPKIYSVYSGDPTSSQSFVDFTIDENSDHLRLLYCIDALNEGIHLDDISGVILFRPTVSPIVYKQQIGRALSANRKKIPVIFDVVNNIENLYSIDSVKEEMQVAITYYRYNNEADKIVTDSFQIIDEVKDCLKLFNQLEKTLSATWDYMYDEAKQYFIEHGSLTIPRNQNNLLSSWLSTQRKNHEKRLLTDSQIALLDEIGMRWESLDEISWNKNFNAYKQYVEDGNPLKVPSDLVYNGVELGKWLTRIRMYHASSIRSDYFTPEREKELEKLGIIWDNVDYLWERNFEAAKAYFVEHGDLNVPHGWIQNGVKLYNWLADLRKLYKGSNGRRGTLTDEQIARLNAIGMRWYNKTELAWNTGYEHAKGYADEHGSADAPLSYVCDDGYKLGVWLSKCREKYAKGSLTDSQIKQLEDIQIVWNKSRKNDWDECFEKAQAYYKEYGNLNVPPSYVADGVWLNKWLNEQKLILQGKRSGKTLTESQIEKLKSIGLTAEEPRDIRWQKRYAELKHYYDTHGNSHIPTDYTDSSGQNLYVWLTNQKVSAKAGKLSDRRKNLLREVGALNG